MWTVFYHIWIKYRSVLYFSSNCKRLWSSFNILGLIKNSCALHKWEFVQTTYRIGINFIENFQHHQHCIFNSWCCVPLLPLSFLFGREDEFFKVDTLLMRNNDHIFTKTLKIREIQYPRSTMLQCLFPEMNWNLAQLAFQAGNEIPAFNGEAALTFFL